jgi:two-component system response regulator HydG
MRPADLDLRELLDLPPTGGVLRFADQRVLLMDAGAMGLLRRELVDRLGETAARSVLTRFGFAHGWRTAEAMRDALPWDSARDWRIAGGRIHMLQGQLVYEATQDDGVSPEGGAFAEAIWRDSYEAQQHLLQFGRSDAPVCWAVTAFASGYLSYSNGRTIYCVERECVGRGDARCRVEGRPAEDWGEHDATALAFFRDACFEAHLAHLTDALKQTEQALRARRKELAAVTPDGDEAAPGLVARSDAMRRVVDLARRVAPVDTTVLITGESGVGKERVARLVHDESPRAAHAFVAVNCGAVTETLLESELFGHARGAFTGATADRPGLFESAHGGTLLLDEVGELSPAMQVRLLRVLQEREVRRVGETRARRVDVRVLAATHRNLADEVAAGRFRQDLYYRLRVVEVCIPPLRARRADVLPLARAVLVRLAARFKRPVRSLSPEAADMLLRYRWPGNVRELENALERAVVLAEGPRVALHDLPEEVRAARMPAPVSEGEVRPLEEVERAYILAALATNGGNQTQTAAQLGIGTATLYRKLRRYEAEGQT